MSIAVTCRATFAIGSVNQPSPQQRSTAALMPGSNPAALSTPAGSGQSASHQLASGISVPTKNPLKPDILPAFNARVRNALDACRGFIHEIVRAAHCKGIGDMSDRVPGFSTLSIHAGAQPDPTTGARATPIYQTTSFVFDDVDHAASLFALQTFGNIYTRITNPTNAVLEERVAALEGGTAALAVASGHAAQVIVFHALMMPGDEIVASKRLYGGSINQLNHAFKSFGWNVVWADPD